MLLVGWLSPGFLMGFEKKDVVGFFVLRYANHHFYLKKHICIYTYIYIYIYKYIDIYVFLLGISIETITHI